MSPNPYEPPRPDAPLPAATAAGAAASRTPVVLAAVGAGLASAYWAILTLLILLGVSRGAGSPIQIVLPFVLIALYAMRGYQLFKGDPAAAKRLLWLHGIGGVAALLQVFSAGGLWMALQSVKAVIHVFGGVTAYLAQKALAEGAPRSPVGFRR